MLSCDGVEFFILFVCVALHIVLRSVFLSFISCESVRVCVELHLPLLLSYHFFVLSRVVMGFVLCCMSLSNRFLNSTYAHRKGVLSITYSHRLFFVLICVAV